MHADGERGAGRPSGRARNPDGITVIALAASVAVAAIALVAATLLVVGGDPSADEEAMASAQAALAKATAANVEDLAPATDHVAQLEPGADLEPYVDPESGAAVLGVVYLRQDSPDQVIVVSRSSTGTCFWAKMLASVRLYAKDECTTPEEQLKWARSW